MTTLRALEVRLQAWQSFRDVAHATRTLAASQVSRWSRHREAAQAHLVELEALARAQGATVRAPVPALAVALGTDVGLCGRLNRDVAERVTRYLQHHDPLALVVVGARLRSLLPMKETWIDEPASSSYEAALGFAQRVEALAARWTRPMRPMLHIIGASDVRSDGTPLFFPHDAYPPRIEAQVAGRVPDRPWVALSSAEELRRALDSLRFHARLVHAACAASHAEASTRLATMTHAHDAADHRIEEQQRRLRTLRQEAITQEMLEVLAGRRMTERRQA